MFKILTKECEPTRGSRYSACIDLYASEDVVIGAGETAVIRLGVCVDFEKFWDEYKKANLYEKSEVSNNSKSS